MLARLRQNALADWHQRLAHHTKCALLALALGLSASLSAPAQTADERSALGAAIDRFEAAFEAGDYSVVLTAMPPRILDIIATQSGVAPDVLAAQVQSQMAAMMAQVTFESFGMDLPSARWGTTSTGLTYALIPTQTIMTPPGSARMQSRTTTLALHDNETWYLIRVDSPQQTTILHQAYPEFGSVTVPTGSMEILD